MVPTRTTRLSTTTGVCKGSIIGAGKIRSFSTLGNIFFNLCKACQAKTMAAIPPSAFTAGRIRETQRRDMQLTTNTKSKADTKFFNMAAFTELSPLKYNSKLMNSIWGFYNRYSPHNVKKVTEDFAFQAELQQWIGCQFRKQGGPIHSPRMFPPLDEARFSFNSCPDK